MPPQLLTHRKGCKRHRKTGIIRYKDTSIFFNISMPDLDPNRFYFWDETWSDAHGPFLSYQLAEMALQDYCDSCLDGRPPRNSGSFNGVKWPDLSKGEGIATYKIWDLASDAYYEEGADLEHYDFEEFIDEWTENRYPEHVFLPEGYPDKVWLPDGRVLARLCD